MSEAQGGTFNSWYEKNKDDYNAKRRERYQRDKGYRRKALKNSRRYRDEGAIGRQNERNMVRVFNGEEVEVFTISAVAEQVGRTAQTIRKWEARGMIPKPVFKSRTRLYTQHQINLLILFAEKFPKMWDDSKEVREMSKQLKHAWRK